MDNGYVRIYYGEGAGKSSAALGSAIRCAEAGGTVYIVQFLKGQMTSTYYERFEPELKLFRFERSPESFDKQTATQHEEEKKNIQNGINFARKVLATGECDMLVLDEVLGAVSEGMVEEEELISAILKRQEPTIVILTGQTLPEGVRKVADSVLNITREK